MIEPGWAVLQACSMNVNMYVGVGGEWRIRAMDRGEGRGDVSGDGSKTELQNIFAFDRHLSYTTLPPSG